MITVSDVEHVAKLARLNLTEEEKKLYAAQLAKIIDYFGELNQVDTTDVEPMSHALEITNVMREDEIVTPVGHEILQKNAPATDSGFFRVPKIGD